MRILVLGAGGIGGYFGGRLAAAGVDVTFQVRPRRAEQIARDGLVIKSPLGDLQLPVKTVLRETAAPGYDAILLSCKAFDLDDAIESLRPAAPGALIVPLLNGMRHLDTLDAAFGAGNVAGGVAQIGVTLDADGTVRHLNRGQGFVFGERDAAQASRCAALAAVLAKGGFEPRHSHEILQDMWEKFVFLCSIAGMCCLMRSNIGAIARTADGISLMQEMLEDCAAVATAAGYAPRARFMEFSTKSVSDPTSTGAASMLRDVQRGGKVEADHVVGDMLARAKAMGRNATLLRAAYAHLQAYQAARAPD
ncbi:2-dehydropantoate 2-reductase [Limobrevibacterium gyesilva]|uniref:2-dehydropantoate 2-reductase n=1 Tax=Limobrevibacterium gyesilva TaxID=2991712 RepID=A0AA41YNX0_9PROT|nr:2-dehydropantoate 2-reductase [Limobrevibacterium gyesilva]